MPEPDRTIAPDRSPAPGPQPPAGVILDEVVGQRFAVVRFSGAPGDYDLEAEELSLRGWLEQQGAEVTGEPLYAFYNSPAMPGPLRRNEIWVEIER